VNTITKKGWRSINLTSSTTPINPDLDIHPTNRYELTQHPTNSSHTTLHIRVGTLIGTIENKRLDKLCDIYNNTANNPPFEESLAHLIHKTNKQQHLKKIERELQLSKAKNIIDTQLLLCGGWPIPDQLYDTLHNCFQIDSILHSNP
jgi:hypothetical protein